MSAPTSSARVCSCDVPQRAAYYVHVIFTVNDNTYADDRYYCSQHLPSETETRLNFLRGDAEVVEYSLTELGGRES